MNVGGNIWPKTMKKKETITVSKFEGIYFFVKRFENF